MQAQCIDLTGKKFHKLTVIAKGNGYYTKGGQYKTTWICQCDCGNVKEIASEKIRKGHTQSCGCVRKQKIANVNFDDITGKKFGRLTVVRFLQPEEREDYRRQWLCRCECGNEVQVNSSKLRNGHTMSCGCVNAEKIGNLNKKYEHTSRRLYTVYKGMLSRCYDKKHREYHNYGKRGIVVCQEWRDDFDKFAEWAYKNGYEENAKFHDCTLDRKDVDKGYDPTNCRWVTNQVQQNNRRDCIYATYNGETHTCMEWSKILGLSYGKLHYHLKLGRTIEYILTH